MPKVRIITERIASLSYKFAEQRNIFLIPVDIIHKDKVLKDDRDDKAEEFIRSMSTFDEIPSTAVPPQGEMIKSMQEAMKGYEQGIYIAASSKLSGIFSAGQKAAQKLRDEGKDIQVFDSQTVVSMEGFMAYVAESLADEGNDFNAIWKYLEKLRDERRVVEYGVIQTLKYLEKNGRIGKAKAWLANIFSFKPIISAKNGLLEPVARARTNNQALELVVQKIKEDIVRTGATTVKVMYDYGLSDDFLMEVVNLRIKEEFDAEVVSYNQISTAIACHLGPEVWGVCVLLE
ncbi:DegV family protein [Candidatus Dojkabacteria bacterium]|nr:DegV family protein [Candidatus Dojkabacteria bacterium]